MADMGGFKEGDVVKVKSGGPDMTIEFIDDELMQVACVWIDSKGKQQNGKFAPAALMKAPAPGIPSIVNPKPIR